MKNILSDDCLYASPEQVARICHAERQAVKEFLTTSPGMQSKSQNSIVSIGRSVIVRVLKLTTLALAVLLAALAILILVANMTSPVFDEVKAQPDIIKQNATHEGGVCT